MRLHLHILLDLHGLLVDLGLRIRLYALLLLLHRLHLHHWLARLNIIYWLRYARLRGVRLLLHRLLLLHWVCLLHGLLVVLLARLHLGRRTRGQRWLLLLCINILYLLLLLHRADDLGLLLVLRILR